MPNLTDLPGQAVSKLQKSIGQYVARGTAELHYLRKIIESGAIGLEPPLNYAALAADIRKWGEVGMLPSHNARRAPNRAAVIDEEGTLTFSELDEAAHAVANGLLAKGVRAGDGVAILARNHRWFVIANYGAARVGARIILLNSEFSGPQIKEVSDWGAKVIISTTSTPRPSAWPSHRWASCGRLVSIPTTTSRRAAPTKRWPS
ncbi:acyl-CoA synthetase [Mycobacterium tuberculosis CAS/NITR204]|uniref:Acyl-CoA synthetase n=1 Tax=Mycobacterium tuberculosis CAS/NITR204 TaxID=1310114 RepID=R4M264_MYCTX|nr:acyl-CoA synthetase [Mycobacterium tuberculosis CAS/NITR204]